MSRKDFGQSYISGAQNDREQRRRWVNGRAVWNGLVTAKRNAQFERLYGTTPGRRSGFLGWLTGLVLRTVAAMTPTVRRLERERKVAQELKHSRLARSKYSPGIHQRRTTNMRKAG